MKIKEMIGEVLAQLVNEDDPIKRTEIIDSAESLNADIPEVNEGGEDYQVMYEEMKQKYITRFGESLTSETVDTVDESDPEPDGEPDDDEPKDEERKPMSYEEAGITT